jgi:hypothetical protein
LRCPNCHAPITDDAESCGHCGTVTERGQELRKKRLASEAEAKQRAEKDAFASRVRQIGEVTAAANRALAVSLLGLLACCLPAGPIAGIVMAQGARQKAQTLGVSPGRAAVALAVAVVSLAGSLFLWGLIGVIAKQEADRKRELHAVIAKEATGETLSAAGACALLELELMNSKYEGFDSFNDELSCPGEVVPHGTAEAKLLGSHFTKAKGRVDVVACFHRSGAWAVKQLRADDNCDAPAPQPPPPTSPSKGDRGKATHH